MSELFIPLALTFAGFLAAFSAYRDIRRGGARFYTLEREAVLRRAGFTLVGSVALFMGAIGFLIYDRQQVTAEAILEEEQVTPGVITVTPTPELEQFPPLPTETATPDLSIPTATPTRPVCRAQVEGTFGNGLTLRDSPGGEQVIILAEGDLVTLLDDPAQPINDLTWRKVRSLFGDEGWVAEEFLAMGEGCEP